MISRHLHRSFSKSCLAVLCLLLIVASGCANHPEVRIDGGAAPTFTLTGQGNIQVITISGPDFDNPKSQDAGSRYMKPYWQIAPKKEADLRAFERAGGLVYGKIPEGFRQVFPPNDIAPPPLPEDELLTFDLRLANANGLGVRFVIHNKRAVVERS